MSEASRSDVRQRLEALAKKLRGADHLEPGAQQELASLLEELAGALGSEVSSGETQQLAEHAAQLAHAVHGQEESGLLASAKRKLAESALQAEAHAPLATGIVRRLIDALANLGI